jgi:hypothetical protein
LPGGALLFNVGNRFDCQASAAADAVRTAAARRALDMVRLKRIS